MASSAVLPPSPSHFSRPTLSLHTRNWMESPQNQHAVTPRPPLSIPSLPSSSTSTTPNKRPKLSVSTCFPRTQGKGSGLRLDTLSAISPTVRNTFSNSYDDSNYNTPSGAFQDRISSTHAVPQYETGPDSHPVIDSITNASSPLPRHTRQTPHFAAGVSLSSRESSPHSSHGALPHPQLIPYILPSNLRSILVNSPLLKHCLVLRTPALVVPAISAKTPMPFRKRVCFREPLVEEIITSTYTLKNSDLPSRSSSTSPSAEEQGPMTAVDISLGNEHTSNEQEPKNDLNADPVPTAKPARNCLDDDAAEETTGAIPQTPVAGRRKRQREWVWTLSPVAVPDAPAIVSDAPNQPYFVSTPSPTPFVEVESSPLQLLSDTKLQTSTASPKLPLSIHITELQSPTEPCPDDIATAPHLLLSSDGESD